MVTRMRIINFLVLANELIVNRQALVPSPDPLDPIFTSSDQVTMQTQYYTNTHNMKPGVLIIQTPVRMTPCPQRLQLQTS